MQNVKFSRTVQVMGLVKSAEAIFNVFVFEITWTARGFVLHLRFLCSATNEQKDTGSIIFTW